MRTKKKSSKDLEDLSGISGWMYSDLLIALMVIFLATITFVPEVYGSLVRGSSTPSNNEKPVYNYLEYYDKPLVKVYEGFDIEFIKQDIEYFLVSENLPINSFIGSIQIVGGYDILNETANVAVERAVAFSNKIDESDPRLLSRASTTISSTSNIRPDQIVLRMTFVVNYGVTN